jgi:hypothetical protein
MLVALPERQLFTDQAKDTRALAIVVSPMLSFWSTERRY